MINFLPFFRRSKRIKMEKKIKEVLNELLLSGRDLSSSDFEIKLDSYLKGKTEDEKLFICDELSEIKLTKLQEYKTVSEEIALLKQFNGIEDYINLSKISKTYFGKTKSWLFQRLHGYTIHGKPAKFTDEEKKELSKALLHLSENIKSVALNMTG